MERAFLAMQDRVEAQRAALAAGRLARKVSGGEKMAGIAAVEAARVAKIRRNWNKTII